MKIRCSECNKKIKTGQQFRKIQGKDVCESCYQKLGGYEFYTALKQLDTESKKPIPPPGYYMLE